MPRPDYTASLLSLDIAEVRSRRLSRLNRPGLWTITLEVDGEPHVVIHGAVG